MSILFLAISGVLLCALWRIASRDSRQLLSLVAAGFLLRALAGIALFWISWFHVPIAASLQRPGGLWFFAEDAEQYLRTAAVAAEGGMAGILDFVRMPPSPFFVQCLAIGIVLFGAVSSIAVLLHAIAFLGACAAIAVTAKHLQLPKGAAQWPVAAIALSPSLVLWSTQPLKDTVMTMLLVGLLLAGLWWQSAWSMATRRRAAIAFLAAPAIWLCLWAIGGIRWNVALILWLCTPILAVTMFRVSRGLRIRATLASLGLVLVLLPSLLFGAQLLLPYHVYQAALQVTPNPATWASFPRALLGDLAATKRAFDTSPGATDMKKKPAKPKTSAELRAPRMQMAGAVPVLDSRLARGVLAMIVPPSLARALGLFALEGGRGLWLFADLDTIVFDAILFAAIASVVRLRRRGETITPMLWYALAVATVFFLLIPYLVTNYGALFRYRSIVYVSLAMIPFVARTLDHP